MSAVYNISRCSTDPMQFMKELLDKVRLLGNYYRISLHAYTAWVDSTLPGEDDLEVGARSTHCNLILSSAISDWHRKERKNGIG